MKRLHHKPILYTWHEDTDHENPIKSFRMWTNTRGKNQLIYIKFKHIKELKAIQVSLFKCYKIFFCLFFFLGTYCFCFYFICSHEPTEKGLQKWIFQGGNREIFFFKEVQLIANLHSETNHRKMTDAQKWKTKIRLVSNWFTPRFCQPLRERVRRNNLIMEARRKRVNLSGGIYWNLTPFNDERVRNINAISNTKMT